MSGTNDPNVVDAEVVDETPASNLPATVEPVVPEADYSEGGVPSFDYVRDKIENRHATSVGASELAGLGTEHTMEALDEKIAKNKEAAKDKLAEIRRSMGKDS
ncbi:hypothetical protein AB5J62_21460 [Amycolatopsis sp. cg5]|uniref:hypothetical protein n=1 Tax=Amycolatopsis sp. cg5 TaxID=3238802 RepID=UPI003523CDC6